MRLHAAVWIAFASMISAPAFAAQTDLSVGAGTNATAGSRGYHKVSASTDLDWKATSVDPFLWVSGDVDNYVREFNGGGGVWKDLGNSSRIKGGAGATLGRIIDTGKTADSFMLEAGAEKDFDKNTIGAEYRFTDGGIGGPSIPSSNDQLIHNRAKGKLATAPSGSLPTYTYNELSAYGSMPLGENRLGLRLTEGWPSYSQSIVSETVSLKVPITKPLSASAALTFEQGEQKNVYVTAGLYYQFR